MNDFGTVIEQFSEKHPVWFWVLVRLVICFCWMFAVVAAVLTLAVVVAPFFGAVIGVWVLVPVLATACWGLVYLALWLYSEFVESW